MAEPQSLPGRTRRPRPRRAIKRLVIWYRRTGPVIRLVNTANSALGPLRLGQTRPGGASAMKRPRLSIAVDGMGGDYAPGPILEGCLGAIEELPLKVMFGDQGPGTARGRGSSRGQRPPGADCQRPLGGHGR